jgi:hypothetical protein
MAYRYSVAKEYKARGEFRVKQVRRDRGLYGEICEYPRRKLADGRVLRVYWAVRLPGEFSLKHQAWIFDKLMFDKFQEHGVPLTHIGVLVTSDTKRRAHIEDKVEEKWLIRRDDFIANMMKEEGGALVPFFGPRKMGQGTECYVPQSAFAKVLREIDPEHRLKEMEVRK